ncbi:MAG: hypothetical protein KGJ13_01185 [Patescibacteria group bacterium]|nr:hypothetical protein [Patescibacteria group bacterium]
MSRKFFLFTIGGFGLALLVFFLAIGGSAFFRSTSSQQPVAGNEQQPPPGPPPPPSISLTIRHLKTGNSLIVQWANLPAETAALDLFCSALMHPTTSSTWTLWREILLSSGELSAGNREIALGKWYERCSVYAVTAISAQQVGKLPIGATTTLEFAGNQLSATGDQQTLWTSGFITPAVTTSTTGMPPGPATSNQQPATSNQQTTSSNQNNNNFSPNPTPPSDDQNPSSSPTNSQYPITSSPSGTPYYNPQVQIVAYAASGSPIFWVQHAYQGIEIGWQNLPPQIDTLIIMRSPNPGGPWQPFLTEKNLPTTRYSLQVVDSAVNMPYYYEMEARAGSSSVATYGPDYLAPE